MNEELSQEEQEEAFKQRDTDLVREFQAWEKATPKPEIADCEKCGGNKVRREQAARGEADDYLRCPECGHITID